jgi:hypothetical protein
MRSMLILLDWNKQDFLLHNDFYRGGFAACVLATITPLRSGTNTNNMFFIKFVKLN